MANIVKLAKAQHEYVVVQQLQQDIYYHQLSLCLEVIIPRIQPQGWVDHQSFRLCYGEEYRLMDPKLHKRPAIHFCQNGMKIGIYQQYQICQVISKILQNE